MEFIRKLNVEDFANFKAVFTVFESEPFFEAWTDLNRNIRNIN